MARREPAEKLFVPPNLLFHRGWNFNRGVSTRPIKILDFRQGSFSSLFVNKPRSRVGGRPLERRAESLAGA